MRLSLRAAIAAVACSLALAAPAAAHPPQGTSCGSGARVLGYSDGLDKTSVSGVRIGGLSALAPLHRRGTYATVTDNTTDGRLRVHRLRGVAGAWAAPRVTGSTVLTTAAGSPVDGTAYDAEGLVALRRGGYLIASETAPSIQHFDAAGRAVGTLGVPSRFRVAPAGQARANATLEGLTISPDQRTVYAAMEGDLSGDADPTSRRILVYERTGRSFSLARQVAYRVQPGNRIAEVQAYGRGRLLVLEGAFSPATGNTIELYATNTSRTTDVSRVPSLAATPRLFARKRLVADVTACPSLGATAKQPQRNPLMDNYEAMTIIERSNRWSRGRSAEVVLLSDDNFNATQITRVLRLTVRLP